MFVNASEIDFYQFIISTYSNEETEKEIDKKLFLEFSDCGKCQSDLSERFVYPQIKVLESGESGIDFKNWSSK